MDPQAEYEVRRTLHQARIEELEIYHRRVAWLRAASFIAAIALAFLSWWWALAAAICFALFALWQARLGAGQARARRLVVWYERAARRWRGEDLLAPSGESWLTPEHPYAAELDILGPSSLFSSLCHAVTAPGQARLAAWLLAPAPAEEIEARQLAVAELAPTVVEREAMVVQAPARLSAPRALATWSLLAPLTGRAVAQLAALLLAALLCSTLVLWLYRVLQLWPFLACAILSFWWARLLDGRLRPVLAPLDGLRAELRAYVGLFELVEDGDFASARLRAISQQVKVERMRASKRARQLASICEALDATRNTFLAPLAALLLARQQLGLWLEAWRFRQAAQLLAAVDALADYEALQSLARDAFENPQHAVPRVDEAATRITAQQVAHPLLPRHRAVANDLELGDAIRLLVVSGSNMSGKSTWLRSIGVNVVLAQCGGRVRAASWRMPPLLLAASLRASDSLAAGESRFAAELHRLRIVLAQAQRGPRLLFLLDELFHGTHSHDRQAGARAFVGRLLALGHLGLFTTHDLALTELKGEFFGVAQNIHFRDDVEADRAHFDYRVHPGVVTHSNALRLMRAQGLID